MAHESCKSQIAVLEMNGQCSKEMDQHRYQNVSIVDFIRAKGDEGGGDNCSYKTSKASVKSPPLTNQHPVFYRPDSLRVTQLCQSTAQQKQTRGMTNTTQVCAFLHCMSMWDIALCHTGYVWAGL